MEITAIKIFQEWFNNEQEISKLRLPSACCLSTIGTDKYPNARFVSLKGVIENSFVVAGTITSQKGIEINLSNKVALTFWWPETERQVRIQGNAIKISNECADKLFAERSKESQIVSIVSKQGQKLKDINELNKKYRNFQENSDSKPLLRPENWSGYMIEPIRVEFMEFKPSRFHQRTLFELINGQWRQSELQP